MCMNKWNYFALVDILALPAIKKPNASKAWIKAGPQEILWGGISTRKMPYVLTAAHRVNNKV